MLIERFRLKGHPGLGDVELDFCDPSGNPAPIVILAGSNGTGKTAVLDAVQRVFEVKPPGPGRVEVDVVLAGKELDALRKEAEKAVFAFQESRMTLGLSPGGSVDLSWPGHPTPFGVNIGPTSPAPLVSLFSTAQVNYPIANHTGVGANDLDRAGGQSRTSTLSLGTDIGQLLVDIRSADAQDTWDWAKANLDQPVPAEVLDRRSGRFQKAIEFVLPRKRLSTLIRTGNKIDVAFQQSGILSTLDMLSSGEQQIVVRGAFLFRDAGKLKDAVVLIDEPELSLHPEWQSRIIDFYRHVLDDGHGKHPQIICATHSPFVVHGTSNGKVIVLERVGGVVRAMTDPSFPDAGAQIAVRAFNLDSFLDAAEKPLLVLTEGETDATILRTAWKRLHPDQARPFDLRSMGADKNISMMLRDDQLIRKMGTRKVVGLFDFDGAFDQWKGVWRRKLDTTGTNVGDLKDEVGTETDGLIRRHVSGQAWAMLLPVPSFRTTYASRTIGNKSLLSVEFMFDDADFLPGMIENVSLPLGQTFPKMRDSYKSRFATHVDSLDSSRFSAFEPLFDRLHAALAGTL